MILIRDNRNVRSKMTILTCDKMHDGNTPWNRNTMEYNLDQIQVRYLFSTSKRNKLNKIL